MLIVLPEFIFDLQKFFYNYFFKKKNTNDFLKLKFVEMTALPTSMKMSSCAPDLCLFESSLVGSVAVSVSCVQTVEVFIDIS